MTLVIRPEDLVRTEVSRQTVTQTLGGAFADNFGPGIPTVQISGHTGWGAGDRPDGLEQFLALHDQIFVQWHEQRADAVRQNVDPDRVKLIFADLLDEFTWVVAPQNFVLRRSRSRPLLSQYQISLVWLSYDVTETVSAIDALKAEAAGAWGLRNDALASLANSLEQIAAIVDLVSSAVAAPLGGALASLTDLASSAVSSVMDIVGGTMTVPDAVAGQALLMAQTLSQASANTYQSVVAQEPVPLIAKANFQRGAAAFDNAFCVLSNIIRHAVDLPNYDDLYGASNCSSTSGGSPISPYDLVNPFNIYQPPETGQSLIVGGQPVPVPTDVMTAIRALATMDPVKMVPLATQVANINTIRSGLRIAA